jgi:hypothetical protein
MDANTTQSNKIISLQKMQNYAYNGIIQLVEEWSKDVVQLKVALQ